MTFHSSPEAASGSDRPATISTTGFSVKHTLEAGEIVIALCGNADSGVAPAFAEYLRSRHAEAQRLAVREVVLDCRELYFLTSSCIHGLADWISSLMALEPSDQYRIAFLTAPNLRWQARSFAVLCQKCPRLVRITTRQS